MGNPLADQHSIQHAPAADRIVAKDSGGEPDETLLHGI
jgi:hypothetical protein